MAKKINVAVLMGGRSAEHEISLISGREVAQNLDSKKYNVLPIVVSPDGITWQIGDRRQNLVDSPANKSKVNSLLTSDHSSVIKNHRVDVVFIAMHGPNGEDGTVQGFLELIGVPYTGSKVLASALGIDKIYSRLLFTQAGLNVPNHVVIEKGEKQKKVWTKLRPPVFVKPRFQGSSVGTSIVSAKKDLKKALNLAHSYDNWAMVEE